MNVVDFSAAKQERQPHWQGAVYCVGCHHECEASAPMGTLWIDCESCGLPKATPKHPFGAQVGDMEFRCLCGGETLTAYKRGGRFWLRCMGCGTDQTQAVFGATA